MQRYITAVLLVPCLGLFTCSIAAAQYIRVETSTELAVDGSTHKGAKQLTLERAERGFDIVVDGKKESRCETVGSGTAGAESFEETKWDISHRSSWEAWQKRVGSCVERQLAGLARIACRHSRSPLSVQVSCVATSSGAIDRVLVTQKSSSVLLNLLACQTVKSLNEKTDVLRFPDGSPRKQITMNLVIRYVPCAESDRVILLAE